MLNVVFINCKYLIMNEISKYLTYLVGYILCYQVILINSRTSTLWKLNNDQTKIIEASPFHQMISYVSSSGESHYMTDDDTLFNIITSTIHLGSSWEKHSAEEFCSNCQKLKVDEGKKNITHISISISPDDNYSLDDILDCGKPVNFTYYDNLVGVLNRNRHPNVPEPHVALIFNKKTKTKNTVQEFDVEALERRLKKAKLEKPKSVQLYNQIGNFWRIKGDTEKSIECFRRALAVSPHNSEVLLNLGRVLFALQYLDDAIYLTRRSLEVHPPDKKAWQQYFTLGEIFKAYGHYQEAIAHLKHALELKPGFEPAQIALKEMESMPAATIHIYTLVIIICLVLGVLLVIISSVDNMVESEYEQLKPQRHFNKAMAMRSLRGLSLQQTKRSKKSLL